MSYLAAIEQDQDQRAADEKEMARLRNENAAMRAALAGVINCAVEPEAAKFAMMVPLDPIRAIRSKLGRGC